MSPLSDSPIIETGRLTAQTFVCHVEHHAELASTNTHALQLAGQADLETPLLVLADRQTAGRGRGANAWWSSEGALSFSLILETAAAGISLDRWPQVSLTTGLAVGEAIRELLPGHRIGLKWPNDVFLDGRKVCGILVEVPPQAASNRLHRPLQGSGRLVIGVGINVNNSFADAPADLQRIATSLYDAAHVNHDLTDFLIHVLQHLDARLQLLGGDSFQLARLWQKHCLLHGRNVHLQTGSGKIVGRCRGIDDHGALLLETAGGLERFFGGIVAHIE